MLTGCYTGGTPNLMAIGMGLNINSETLVMVNTCDMVLGGCYFFLMVSVVKLGLRKILPKFQIHGRRAQRRGGCPAGDILSTEKGTEQKACCCAACLRWHRPALPLALLCLYGENGRSDNHTGGNHLRNRAFLLEKNPKHARHLEHGAICYIGVFHGDRLHGGHTAVFQLITPHFRDTRRRLCSAP